MFSFIKKLKINVPEHFFSKILHNLALFSIDFSQEKMYNVPVPRAGRPKPSAWGGISMTFARTSTGFIVSAIHVVYVSFGIDTDSYDHPTRCAFIRMDDPLMFPEILVTENPAECARRAIRRAARYARSRF